MQNWLQTLAVPKLMRFSLLLYISFPVFSQTESVDSEHFENLTDSLFQVNQSLIMDDSASKVPAVWVSRGDLLSQIANNSNLAEKYKSIDFQLEISNTWSRAIKIDRKGEWKSAIETGLAASAIDLYNLGLASMENARKFKSVGDAERAEELFRMSMESYKKAGSKQGLVDQYWFEVSANWKWLRFYHGMSLRMAERLADAENEYAFLAKMEWDEPVLFIELADLQRQAGKSEEGIKTLQKAHIRFSGNVPIACALTRMYLAEDKMKQAMATIKKFDADLGNHPELVLTKALVYEKKGDIKKADAMFKALYQFDKYEVQTNVAYAAYLIRKAKTADKMDAQEFAQLAFNLIEKASDLSPSNDELKIERDAIKFQYPKVHRDEDF